MAEAETSRSNEPLKYFVLTDTGAAADKYSRRAVNVALPQQKAIPFSNFVGEKTLLECKGIACGDMVNNA
jgi:hypothetical protein